MEDALIDRLSARRDRHPAVVCALDTILRPAPVGPLSELAADVGLSHRRFIELFTRHVDEIRLGDRADPLPSCRCPR